MSSLVLILILVVLLFGGGGGLWLLKIPNAPKSLEFLDSPTQYRRHVHAGAMDRFSACMPIP